MAKACQLQGGHMLRREAGGEVTPSIFILDLQPPELQENKYPWFTSYLWYFVLAVPANSCVCSVMLAVGKAASHIKNVYHHQTSVLNCSWGVSLYPKLSSNLMLCSLDRPRTHVPPVLSSAVFWLLMWDPGLCLVGCFSFWHPPPHIAYRFWEWQQFSRVRHFLFLFPSFLMQLCTEV